MGSLGDPHISGKRCSGALGQLKVTRQLETALTFGIYRQRRDRDQRRDSAQRERPGVQALATSPPSGPPTATPKSHADITAPPGCGTFARVRSFRGREDYGALVPRPALVAFECVRKAGS